MHSKQDIENAARLVPKHVKYDAQCQTWFAASVYSRSDDDSEITSYRQWQPWADTEAGRSDALVLLAAVMYWIHTNSNAYFNVSERHWVKILDALDSGNVKQIQQATMAAAIAIGQYMEQSNEN